MSKRKVEFDLEAEISAVKEKKKVDRRFKEKHSLDSDEEDDDKDTDKYNILDDDDIEGQEDTHVDYEEGQKFTAFNMQDEMEDGHFDKDGTFIFNKEAEIKDGWIDNIDWVKVKELSKKEQTEQEKRFNSDDEDEDDSSFDNIAVYKQILVYIKPGESITKAIKRLGGSKPLKSWQKKKKNTPEPEVGVDKKAMLKLTELVDKLTQRGDYDVYQYTHEKLSFMISQTGEKKPSIPEGIDDDDALDMFADSLDDKKDDKPSSSSTDDKKESMIDTSGEASCDTSGEVSWFYKNENTDSAEVHGPHTSSEMLEMQENGSLNGEVFVRKLGAEGDFYSSKRIDFDLYT